MRPVLPASMLEAKLALGHDLLPNTLLPYEFILVVPVCRLVLFLITEYPRSKPVGEAAGKPAGLAETHAGLPRRVIHCGVRAWGRTVMVVRAPRRIALRGRVGLVTAAAAALMVSAACAGPPGSASSGDGHTPSPVASTGVSAGSGAPQYPWHTSIAATSFWVGQVISGASDGSQVVSTYDPQWESNYGGCDGVATDGQCRAEPRTAENGFFPTAMTPRQNPFYLDLPFDDVHNAAARAERATVIPWAHDPRYADQLAHGSLMKNHWVEISTSGHTCFGQIEDAGPTIYGDARYVFGTHDERPANKKINNAGMDVSPALNGCLAFSHGYDSDQDRVDWRFVDDAAVPSGPWTRVVTTNPATLSATG